MFHKTILISCVYLLTISFLAYGDSKDNRGSQAPCRISIGSNTSCVNVTNNMIKNIFNKSIEAFRYQFKLISISPCNIPANKLDPSHPVIVRNTVRRVSREVTLLDVEIRNSRKVGPVIVSIRTYSVNRNSAKDLVFKIDRATCNHTLMLHMGIVLKLDKFINEKCYGNAGVHKVDSINIDDLSGPLQRTVTTAGIYSYEIEFAHPQGILVCYVLNSQVTERKLKP